MHVALNEERLARSHLGSARAGTGVCRLANLRTARMADLELTPRVTRWLRRPAAEFLPTGGTPDRRRLDVRVGPRAMMRA